MEEYLWGISPTGQVLKSWFEMQRNVSVSIALSSVTNTKEK